VVGLVVGIGIRGARPCRYGFTPIRRMMTHCCRIDSVLFQAQ
jgi:hypothetical protein